MNIHEGRLDTGHYVLNSTDMDFDDVEAIRGLIPGCDEDVVTNYVFDDNVILDYTQSACFIAGLCIVKAMQ